jgi:hypothetical protein
VAQNDVSLMATIALVQRFWGHYGVVPAETGQDFHWRRRCHRPSLGPASSRLPTLRLFDRWLPDAALVNLAGAADGAGRGELDVRDSDRCARAPEIVLSLHAWYLF